MRVLSACCSFEAGFLLFLFAGVFKGDPRFGWIPVDLTAMFLAVSIIGAFSVLIRRGLRLPVAASRTVLMFALFAAYMAASLGWTAGEQYGSTKALYTGTLVLWALAGSALIIAPETVRVYRFLGLLCVFAVWVALESGLALRTAGTEGNLSALGGLYLGLGRVLGAGAVVCLALGVLGAITGWQRAGYILLAGGLVSVMLLVGGRGPLFGVGLAGFTLALLGWRQSAGHVLAIRAPILGLGAALAGLGVAIALLAGRGNAAFATIRRLTALFDTGPGSSTADRLHYYASAIQGWSMSPIQGNGVGSWPVLTYNLDVRGYPHNLILETLSELGLVGLILLAAVPVTALAGFRFRDGRALRPLPVLLLMLLANALFNALVSGDLPDNRFLFVVIGLMTIPIGRVTPLAPTRGLALPQEAP